jgi:hypothetical protein
MFITALPYWHPHCLTWILAYSKQRGAGTSATEATRDPQKSDADMVTDPRELGAEDTVSDLVRRIEESFKGVQVSCGSEPEGGAQHVHHPRPWPRMPS